MAGMNINELKKAVLLGNIATLKAQIIAMETYQERTDVDMTEAIAAVNAHIAQIQIIIDAS